MPRGSLLQKRFPLDVIGMLSMINELREIVNCRERILLMPILRRCFRELLCFESMLDADFLVVVEESGRWVDMDIMLTACNLVVIRSARLTSLSKKVVHLAWNMLGEELTNPVDGVVQKEIYRRKG